MKDKALKNELYVCERNYKINTLNINNRKKLSLFGLLGILQDIAGEHADMLGFGYNDLLQQQCFWVLIRQKLRMEFWPQWNDTITVKTWPQPLSGIYAFREYEIFVGDKKAGDCSTTWITLDSETRKPKKLENTYEYLDVNTKLKLDYTAQKIVMPPNVEKLKSFEVRNSDLDINEHVNNIKYSQWILDAIAFEYHKNYLIEEYEVNFMGETFLNNKIDIYSNIYEAEKHNENSITFKAMLSDSPTTVLIARLKVKSITEP